MACSRPQGWSLGPAQLLAAKSGINFTGRTRVRKSHSIRTRLFTAHNNTALAHVPCAHLQQKGRDTRPSRTLPGQAQDGISSTHPTLKSHPSPFSSLLPAAQGWNSRPGASPPACPLLPAEERGPRQMATARVLPLRAGHPPPSVRCWTHVNIHVCMGTGALRILTCITNMRVTNDFLSKRKGYMQK